MGTATNIGQWTTADPEWHAARRWRVGGSDIGVIMGWSPFQTRAELLAQKRSGERRPPTRAMLRGTHLEPAIAAWLAADKGLTYDDKYRGTWVAGDYLFNPDAVTTDGRLCEFKTAAVRDAEHGWGRAGTDKVPLAYAAQCLWGMGILDLPETILAVVSGAPKFDLAVYRLKANPIHFAYLRGQANRFLTDLKESVAA